MNVAGTVFKVNLASWGQYWEPNVEKNRIEKVKTGKEEVVEEVPCVLLAEMMEVGGSIGWQVYWIVRGLAL